MEASHLYLVKRGTEAATFVRSNKTYDTSILSHICAAYTNKYSPFN
jgi:hypothetical protein